VGRRVTQRDIAQLVGVSRSTVSRVLNNDLEGGINIPAETRQRILAAARVLGYAPHAVARSLRSGLTSVIGILIPDCRNPHFWAIFRGAEAAAREHGYHVLVTISNLELNRERQCLEALAQQRMDGLILVLTHAVILARELEDLRQQVGPIVTLHGSLPGKDALMHGYAEGMAQAMAHLLELGHERIAFIHGVANPTLGTERLGGYLKAMKEAGLPTPEEYVVQCGGTVEEGLEVARRLLDLQPRPTAIVGVNDLMAIATLQAAAERGLSVPGDLSVVGFDDIELAKYLVPPLTTVGIDAELIGRQAVDLLFQRLVEPQRPAQTIVVPAHLIVRKSTGPCRS